MAAPSEALPCGEAALLRRARDVFTRRFGRAPTAAAAAPGRVNLIGDHVDYCEGYVLPMGTISHKSSVILQYRVTNKFKKEQNAPCKALPFLTVIVGALNDSDTCRVVSVVEAGRQVEASFSTPSASPLTPGEPAWANYVKGVVANFPSLVQGFDAAVVSDLPMGAGLSSSASVEVVTFTLLEELTGSKTEPVQKARLCQKAEHEFPGMPCGIMDQYVVTMAKKDHALLIDCRSLESTQVPIASGDSVVLVVNSNVKHQLTGSEYPTRRAQCQAAADSLGMPSLRGATRDQLADLKLSKCEADVLKRAEHVVEEIRRTEEVAKCLERRELERVGKLLYDSHESLRDLMEVSCAELDQLVAIARSTPGVIGARMTGGGFGGSMVVIVKKNAVEDLKKRILSQYKGNPTFLVAVPSDGARVLSV